MLRKWFERHTSAISRFVVGRLDARERAEAYRRELIEDSGLFDGDWYLQAYPDVARAGADPLSHFLRDGWREGRDPGPKFATNAYLKANPDVARSQMNPLIHFVEFGRSEGRESYGHHASIENWVQTDFGFAAPHPCASFGRPERGFSLSWRSTDELETGRPDYVEIGGLPIGYTSELSVRAEIEDSFATLSSLSGNRPDRSFKDLDRIDQLADAWLLNPWILRTRWINLAEPIVVRGYQHDAANEGSLRRVAEVVLAGPLGLADLRLTNPYFPLLLTVSQTEGRVLKTQVLPFPSLCRGGLHYVEALAGAGTIDPFRMGAELARRMQALFGGAAPMVSELQVDLDGEGYEGHLFKADFQCWLEKVVRISVSMRGGSLRTDQAAGAMVNPRPGRVTGGGVLSISPDSVPAIAGLVAQEDDPDAPPGDYSPPVLFAGRNFVEPALLVEPPAEFPNFRYLKSQATPVEWPRLTARNAGRLPVAVIRHFDRHSLSDAELLFPTTARTTSVRHDALTWLIDAASSDPAAAVRTIQSLALQDGAETDSITLIGKSALTVVAAAEQHFGGRTRRVTNQLAAVRGLETDLAAFVAPGVVLHDSRSATILAALLQETRVATASCVLVSVSSRRAGWLPVLVDSGAISSADGRWADLMGQGLWRSVYGVSIPSSHLWMGRSALIREWSERPRRADAGNLFHVCTAQLTASIEAAIGNLAQDWVPPARPGATTRVQVLLG